MSELNLQTVGKIRSNSLDGTRVVLDIHPIITFSEASPICLSMDVTNLQ